MKPTFIIIALPALAGLALLLLVAWAGIRVQIGTKKDDPSSANLTLEMYPLRRFFK